MSAAALIALAAGSVWLQGFSLPSLTVLCAGVSLALAFAAWRVYRQNLELTLQPIALVMALLAIWLCCSMWLAVAPATAALAVFQQAVLPLAFFTAAVGGTQPASWARLSGGVAVIATLLALAALLAAAGAFAGSIHPGFVQRNSFSAWLLLALFVAIPAWHRTLYIDARSWAARVLWSAMLFVIVLAVFMLASRGVLLALGCGFIGFYLSLNAPLKHTVGRTLLAGLLWAFLLANLGFDNSGLKAARSFGVVVEVVGEQQSFDDLIDAVQSSERSVQHGLARGSGSQRLILWQGISQLLPAVPWHGFGPGSFRLVYPAHASVEDRSDRYYAHNDPLQLYIELGVPGVAILIGLAVLIVRRRQRSRRELSEAAVDVELEALFWGMTAVALHSLLSYNFYVPATLLLFGFVLARYARLGAPTTAKTVKPRAVMRASVVVVVLLGVVLLPIAVLGSASLMSGYHQRGAQALAAGKLEQAADLLQSAAVWYANADTEVLRARNLLAGAEASHDASRATALVVQAKRHIERANTLNPLNPTVPHARHTLELSDRQLSGGALEQALAEHFTEVLRIDPWYFPIRMAQARYLYSETRYAAAEAVLAAGLRRAFPRDRGVLDYLHLLREVYEVQHDQVGKDRVDAVIARVVANLSKR